MFKKICLISFILTTYYLLLATDSIAAEFQSPRFKIEMGNVDIEVAEDKNPANYTIKSIYGSEGYDEFISSGYMLAQNKSDKPLTLFLSQALISIPLQLDNPKNTEEISLVFSNPEVQNVHLQVLQEQLLKNFSGETIGLDYSLGKLIGFRTLAGKAKTLSTGKSEGSLKIKFKPISTPHNSEGTYDSIINFIANPEL